MVSGTSGVADVGHTINPTKVCQQIQAGGLPAAPEQMAPGIRWPSTWMSCLEHIRIGMHEWRFFYDSGVQYHPEKTFS
jgi:hypothetical protein